MRKRVPRTRNKDRDESDNIARIEKELNFLLNDRAKQELRLYKIESWMRSNIGYIAELDIDNFILPVPPTSEIPFIPFAIPSGIIKSECDDKENVASETNIGLDVDMNVSAPRKKDSERTHPVQISHSRRRQGLSDTRVVEETEPSSSSSVFGEETKCLLNQILDQEATTTREYDKTNEARSTIQETASSNSLVYADNTHNHKFNSTLLTSQGIKGFKIPTATKIQVPGSNRPGNFDPPSNKNKSTVIQRTNLKRRKNLNLFCRKCSKKFKTLASYNTHKSLIHKKYECRSCFKGFETESSLKQHLRDRHVVPKILVRQARINNGQTNNNNTHFPTQYPVHSPRVGSLPSKQKEAHATLHHMNQTQFPDPLSLQCSFIHNSTTKGSNSTVGNKMQSALPNSNLRQQQTGWKTPDFNPAPSAKIIKPSLPHSCSVCRKSFSHKNNLVQHFRTHQSPDSTSAHVVLNTSPAV